MCTQDIFTILVKNMLIKDTAVWKGFLDMKNLNITGVSGAGEYLLLATKRFNEGM